MSMGVKKIVIATLVVMALPLFMTGCKKKSALNTCKTDADCRVDATGAEINGVCYMGKCEECAQDTDCSDLKQCINNRCLSACLGDTDCGAGTHCENSFCVADCTGNESCPSDHVCTAGRCVGEGGVYGMLGQCKGIERIHFDFDRYDIKPEYKVHADRLAKCLEDHPDYVVTVGGHADNRGTQSYNMALAQKRANAVQQYLKVNKGIASHRVKTQSYGDTSPLRDENTEDAWQQNRRAEFNLQNKN